MSRAGLPLKSRRLAVAFVLPVLAGAAVIGFASLLGATGGFLALVGVLALSGACGATGFLVRSSTGPALLSNAECAVGAPLAGDGVLLGFLETLAEAGAAGEPREWQDVLFVTGDGVDPAPKSVPALCEAAHRGLLVERVLVLPDNLWPGGEALPTPAIRPWIEGQHNHGLWLVLLRQADVPAASDRAAGDFGLLNQRIGWTRRTGPPDGVVTYRFETDPDVVAAVLLKWQRLSEAGTPYRVLLDRAEPAG